MRIVKAILETLNIDAPIREVRVGAFITAVWARRMGLAYTLVPDKPHGERMPIPKAGMLSELSCRQLAQMALSNELPQPSIGMAALNALIAETVESERFEEADGAQILMRVAEGKRTALIGHFPFVEELRRRAGQLMVFEERPLMGDLPAHKADELLPQAQIVAITGSAFVNHTIEHLLELSRGAELVMVIGPTTPLSKVLFEFGVDIIAGSIVVEPETVMRYVGEGATFKQLRGVKKVVMRQS
ncbi:MAG: DUF364 domain-containing protein [Armatimonadota bacterium]|nr:DUF364 domain-containing protein [Armatimonadota bacterium]MCX7777226.1 DUF364 domain-containing protein [Armatimonadota bacterium]MDW8024641.1 DUF364 domain-containing protein [Armatimonadota bacterium]